MLKGTIKMFVVPKSREDAAVALVQLAQRGGGGAPCLETAKVSWMGSEHLMELWVSLFIAGGLD